MRPRPRLRKTIKWAGAAATVLLVAVWIGSAWSYVTFVLPRQHVLCLSRGSLGYQHAPGVRGWPPPPGFYSGWAEPRGFRWGVVVTSKLTSLPLWIPTAAVLALTIAAWRLDVLARRRDRLTLCSHCRYDRTGLAPGAVCPECGRSPG